MKTDIIPCICCDHEPDCGDSVYYGMPQLKVTDKMDYFEAYCPNCGRGGMFQYKSAYLAIKEWNKMQERLRRNDIMHQLVDNEAYTDNFQDACKMAIEALQEPERKKGQWEDFDYDNSYLCTSCGEIWILNDGTPEENNMNYCPKCGADMRGEKE